MFRFLFGGAGSPALHFFFLLAAVAPVSAQQQPDARAPLLRGSSGAEDPGAYRSPAGSSIPAYGSARPAELARNPDDDSAALAPNYGKPRRPPDKRARYPGRRPIAAKTLPAAEPYRTAPASVRAQPQVGGAGAPQPGAEAPPPPTFAATPAPAPRRRPRLEDDPYGPLGLRLGNVLVTPYVDAQAGYDSNPRRAAAAQGSLVLRGGAGFAARSDWSRHELSADVDASYLRFTRTPDADRPEATGKAALRLDVMRDTFANFELRGALTTQRPGSPNVPGATINQPEIVSFGATAGATQRFGRLETSVSFLVDRRMYGDARLAGGGVSRLSEDNYNAYGARGRIAYEYTPGVKPFLEVGGDLRRRDEAIDSSGFDRDSSGLLARAGSTFEITRTLTGEASAGYARRVYNDNRLPILAGPTFDGRLVWSVTPLTTVTLRAATELNETTVAAASGSIGHTVSADVAHALLRNLTLGAGVSFNDTRYKGASINERAWSGTLRAEYAFNRWLRVRGSYSYESLSSSQPGSSYDAHVVLLGLRLQK